jgi:LacI family transcriptional regulator
MLSDVARVAGVSLATASRALTGSPTVRADLAARVVDAAALLGYQPNAVARTMSSGSSALVGLVSDRLQETHVGTIGAGVVEAADARALTVMMSSGSAAGGDISAAVRTMIGFRPRALVIASRREQLGVLATDPIVLRYAQTGGRIVAIGRSLTEQWIPEVHLDDVGGAEAIAEQVRRAGYRRPVILNAQADLPAEQLRAETLVHRVSDWAGYAPPVVHASELTRDGGFAATMRILRSHPEVDVILAVADELAVGAVAALRECGSDVAARVGVTGFDDLPQAADIVPSLTTVRTDLRLAGSRALAAALDNADPAIVHAAQLVVRDSIRRP